MKTMLRDPMRPIVLVPKTPADDLRRRDCARQRRDRRPASLQPVASSPRRRTSAAPLVATSANLSGEPVFTEMRRRSRRGLATSPMPFSQRPADRAAGGRSGLSHHRRHAAPVRHGRGIGAGRNRSALFAAAADARAGRASQDTRSRSAGEPRGRICLISAIWTGAASLALLKQPPPICRSSMESPPKKCSATRIPATPRRVLPRARFADEADLSSRGPCIGARRRDRAGRRLAGVYAGTAPASAATARSVGRRSDARTAGPVAPRGDPAIVRPDRRRARCARTVAKRACPVLGSRARMVYLPARHGDAPPRLEPQTQLPAHIIDRPPVRWRRRAPRPRHPRDLRGPGAEPPGSRLCQRNGMRDNCPRGEALFSLPPRGEGRGGGREALALKYLISRPPPPTPPRKGEGRRSVPLP